MPGLSQSRFSINFEALSQDPCDFEPLNISKHSNNYYDFCGIYCRNFMKYPF